MSSPPTSAPTTTTTRPTFQESIAYLLDVEEAISATASPLEFHEAMLARHPHRLDPGSPWGAAKLFKPSA